MQQAESLDNASLGEESQEIMASPKKFRESLSPSSLREGEGLL